MPVDFTSTSIQADSDYGPYSCSGLNLSGLHSYVFTLNRYNGLWQISIDGSDIGFVATSNTTNPQPDGTTVTEGVLVSNKYFSDESAQSGQNVADLGWPDAIYGIGGTGDYRIKFSQASGSYIQNLTVVPEPATLALLGLGGLALTRRKKQTA